MSGKVDMGSPTANMFGLEPCPSCGGAFRVPLKDGWGEDPLLAGLPVARCDDCGREELLECAADLCGLPFGHKGGHGPAGG